MTKAIKVVFASLLVIMLLTLGGLSVALSGLRMPLTSAASSAALSQDAQAQQAVQVRDTTATTGTATTAQPAPVPQGKVVDARATAKEVGPAVVTVVNNLQAGGFGGRGSVGPEALGSGLIIDNQGHIVTNNHVVENQQSLQVIFSDGKQVPATLVGTDAFSDIAVIKVDGPVPAVAQFGDSDTLEVGQPVIAIGSALGDYPNTVTEGIVSGLHRAITDAGASTSLRDLVQTDAAINHGNSGGPLVDIATGNVIGINTAVVRTTGTGAGSDVAEGLGFAIPSNTVQSVVGSLLKNGSVARPYIGIEYTPIDAQVVSYYSLPVQNGVYVTSVAQGSPAASAGIQSGSVVTKIDDATIDDTNTLVDILLKYKVGDAVKLTVIPPNGSIGSETIVTVVLGTRPNTP